MSDMALPADYPTIPKAVYDEVKLVKLARQIAMGLKPVPDILFDNGLTLREFDEIQRLPLYGRVLVSELKGWEAATNTHGRLKLKAAAMIEEYLPEMYARLNDANEPLMAKIKALEAAMKLAGIMERADGAVVSPGDRVQVTINLGADTRVEYVKTLPSKVIDHEPTPPPTVPDEQAIDQTFEQQFEESLNASPH